MEKKQETNYYKIIGVYPSDSPEYIEKQAKLKIIRIKAALAKKDYQMLDASMETDDARLKQIAIEKIAEIEQAREILSNLKTRIEFDIKTYGKSYFKKNTIQKKRDPEKKETEKKETDVVGAIIVAVMIIGFITYFVLPDRQTSDPQITPKSQITPKWYQNGNLHKGSVAQWKRATYANKLATAADWSMSRPQIKTRVMQSNNIDTLKPFAINLLSCVDEAAAGEGYEESMKIAEITAVCMHLMKW